MTKRSPERQVCIDAIVAHILREGEISHEQILEIKAQHAVDWSQSNMITVFTDTLWPIKMQSVRGWGYRLLR